MPTGMEMRPLVRLSLVGALVGLMAGCGPASLDSRDANQMPGDAAPKDANDYDVADARDATDAPDAGPPDGPTTDGPTTDGPTTDGPTTDGPTTDGADGSGLLPVDRWIYVATAAGVQRIDPSGGGFLPFGVAAATRSVAVSPSGALIAQELADQRVAVIDSQGATRATFDFRQGLAGFSDDGALMFVDPVGGLMRQTSVDGQTRRYVPNSPEGVASWVVSPDRSLLAATLPQTFEGIPIRFVSVVDAKGMGSLGPYPGTPSAVWTGDSRALVIKAPGQYAAFAPRTGVTTPLTSVTALDAACAYGSWYETGKILLGRSITQPATPTCIPAAVYSVDTGSNSSPGNVTASTNPFVPPPFAQDANGQMAAIAVDATLELGPVAGGARRALGAAAGPIVSVGWAHPTGGTTDLVATTPPPVTVAGLAGAPPVASRSGGSDCRNGVWINRTPNPIPAGWPRSQRSMDSALDSDRGTLLIAGAIFNGTVTQRNLDYDTMEWDGAQGQWTNRSRSDGFGPGGSRALTYDSRHKVVLGLGANLAYDGPWTWTPAAGWKNGRFAGAAQPKGYQNGGASVYDAGRDRWVVSGGYDPTTWEWDGTSWMKSTAAAPAGATQVLGLRLVYDSKRARVYALGGVDGGASPWLWDPAQNRWTALPSTGASPLPRQWAGVAYDSRRDRVVVFGGSVFNPTAGSHLVNDMAEWDPASGTWLACSTTSTPPDIRFDFGFGYDPKRDVHVLFGGSGGSTAAALAEVWEWYVP